MEGLFEIYKEQAELRSALEKLLEENGGKENGKGSGDALSQMEALEKQLLEKGINSEIIENIKRLNYELLKLEKAQKEQGYDTKRTARQNSLLYKGKKSDELILKKQYFNFDEILNRQSLPLRSLYKKKVQEYFKKEQ